MLSLDNESIVLATATHDHGERVEVDHSLYDYSECGKYHVLNVSQGKFWRYECYASISPYGWKKGEPPCLSIS